MIRQFGFAVVLGLGILWPGASSAQSAWQIGAPIATYWAGPPITDTSAKQMRDGGFNLIWCNRQELNTAARYGLRAMLQDGLLVPATLDDPAKLAELDSLVEQVKGNKALYAYFLADEPSAAQFEGLGRLVAYLRKKDPAHLAYINLFPTYANSQQLGVSGDTASAYREYVRRFVETVKPSLLSYDHYHFNTGGDGDQYFMNLALIRQAALSAGVPFLNIVQACAFDQSRRMPTSNELHWLASTSLAYGAQGLSYFVYFYQPYYDSVKDGAGMMMRPDGTTTRLYEAARKQHPEFVAVARQLQDLRSLGAYHVGAVPLGAEPLPPDSAFRVDADKPVLIGTFGRRDKPTYAYVVNLDYRAPLNFVVKGPGRLETFDPATGKWSAAGGASQQLELAPGGGILVRLQ